MVWMLKIAPKPFVVWHEERAWAGEEIRARLIGSVLSSDVL